MRDEPLDAICRRHPELVAALESRQGRWALLLHHTVVPLTEERAAWMAATRRAARAVIADLRAAGVGDRFIVLQWRPLTEISQVLRTWSRRWEGDGIRLEQILSVVAGQLADRQFLAAVRTHLSPALVAERLAEAIARGALHPMCGDDLLAWYRDMTPSWLDAEPPLRRELVLRAHQWIVQYALGAGTGPGTPGVWSLRELPGGVAAALLPAIPADEIDRWQPWLRLVAADLHRALSWPAGRRHHAWARWLFLIPYSIPVRATPDPARERRKAEARTA